MSLRMPKPATTADLSVQIEEKVFEETAADDERYDAFFNALHKSV